MIHTHSIEQRELQNPSQHIVNNQYIASTTVTPSCASSPSSNLTELDKTVDEYINELVQDQFELAYTQYIHTHTQPQEQNLISNHSLHAPIFTFTYAGLSPTITKLLKTFTVTRMLTWCLLFWSLSSLVKYALFTDRALPTREAALPLPFFGNASSMVVEDYFRGNGADKSLLMSKAELTILMFYAPWSLHSMEARQPFLEVAAAFKDLGNQTIKFVAINCNDHRGQCKSMYKLYYFPVIFGYVMGGVPIVYNQPITTDHLFSWVSHLLMPDKQIDSLDDFNHFTEFYDYSVIGYLPLESASQANRAFNVFLMSAYKSAGSRTTTGFASFQSSELAKQVGFEFPNHLKLYTSVTGQPVLLSSLTLHKTVKSDGVVKWIQDNAHSLAHKAVHQLNFEEEELGGKSEMLFRKLNSSSATLVLFSENYGLPYLTDSHNALRQVAKTFHNCESAQNTVNSMNSMRVYVEDAKLSCLLQHNKNEKIVDCCASLHTNHLCTQTTEQSSVEQREHSTHQCLLVNKVVDQKLFHRKCCAHYASNNNWRNNSGHSGQQFHFSLRWKAKQSCRFLRLMRKTQSVTLRGYTAEITADGQSDHSSQMLSMVEGLGCKTNKTIGFLMIDKRFAHYFIRRWGGDGYSDNSEESLAIVSNPDEKIYWMQKMVNKINIETILHEYITDRMLEPKVVASMPVLSEHNFTPSSPSMSNINRLTASSFTAQILNAQNSFDSLVFFTGGRRWHGPSQVVSYILHSIKHYFKQFDSLLHFYWYLHASSSVNGKLTIPRNLPLTIPNLMAFLLSRVQPELRTRLAISACTSQCLQNNLLQISQFKHNIGEDVRSLRRLVRRQQHSPLIKSQFRLLIRRRIVQKKSADHLHKMLELFQQTKHQALNKTIEDALVSDALFMKWLVTNRLGLTFKS